MFIYAMDTNCDWVGWGGGRRFVIGLDGEGVDDK